jgi:hypothetical protein
MRTSVSCTNFVLKGVIFFFTLLVDAANFADFHKMFKAASSYATVTQNPAISV